jgi:hypothetical protein
MAATNDKEPTEDDSLDTPEREALRELYHERGIIPREEGFGCPNLPSCSEAVRPQRLLTGTYAYVGTAYGEARAGGKPVRILFAAMDLGGQEYPERWVFAKTQSTFRRCTVSPENAHMWGVRGLLGAIVDDKRPEVFCHQYALANAVKCTKATGSMKGATTSTLVHNCAEHLRAEIDLLNPQLIVTQGKPPECSVRRQFRDLRSLERFRGERRSAEVLVGERFVVLVTPHPSRCPGWCWRHGLPQFVADAVHRAQGEVHRLTA